MTSEMGKSGHIVDMMQSVIEGAGRLPDPPQYQKGYCAHGIEDYLEFDCQNCSLVNYGRDCHNNPVMEWEGIK